MSADTYSNCERRPLGRSSLRVTRVCVGASPLASVPEIFGYEVPVQQGVDTVRRVLRGPVNFLDNSAIYGLGESERRIGLALADEGGVPNGSVLATKADRDPMTGDFSAGQVRRSPLAAAAMHVSLRDPRITSTVVGLSRPERVEETLLLASTAITAELEAELEALVPSAELFLS